MYRNPSNWPGEDGVVVGSAQTRVATALQAIGEIQSAIGSVTVRRDGGIVAQVDVGDLVYQGDAIATGADGAVGIIFTDGTVFNLSNDGRAVLNEFAYDPNATSNSALLSLAQGTFAFIAGKVAKTGGLRIDTPFARIRDTAQDRGIGILTLAALTFAAIKEAQAASRSDAFLDDGTITYKDLAHGTFEITTRDGRVVLADDPGETIVVDPAGSVTRIPNSSSRMAELQQAQQSAAATLSLGQQGSAPGGSSSSTFDLPVQLQPINSIRAENAAAAEHVTVNITPTSSGFTEVPQLKAPPVVTPVLTSDAGLHAITEVFNTTGNTTLDTTPSGTLNFTDFTLDTVSASVASITWSAGGTLPSGLAAALAGALSTTTDKTSPNSGSIATTFTAADHNFDFLAANETLTIVYNVTLTDNKGSSLTLPVTITTTGTNDAPVLTAEASGPHTTTELSSQTGDTTALDTASGTLTFTDVDLSDHHTVSTSVVSTSGATLPSGLAAVLAGALSTTTSDSTASGSGSIAVTFGAADDNFDFLAAGQTLTITYDVMVTDNNGVSSTQPFTITITGTNDAPVATITPTTYSATEQVSLNLKNSMSVSDVDSLGGVETATLSVTEGTLTVTAGTSGATVQGSGSSSVTITGTLAQINALLNTDATSAVSYIDPTDTPSPSATLTLAINDNGNSGTGAALTGSDTAIINIGSVNDAPVATITPTTYSATEQVSLNLKNSMSVSDVDSLGGVETATLSVTEGTLTVTAGTSGATVQGSGSSSVTITGTLAQINALLNTDATSAVSYIDPTDTPSPSATLTLAINDNGNSGTGAALTGSDTAIINIGSVNDAPVATITPTTYSATEQVSLNLKNSMSVSDVDSLGGVETATLSVTEGTLTVTAGTSGATVQGSGSSSVTITGTLAQINALLNTDATSAVSYIDPTDTPSPSATLTLAINDNGNSGTGAALTGSDTAIINIGSVNDAPVATITPTTYSATEQVSLNLKNSMSVSDVDSLGGVETATLSVTEGTLTVTAGTSGATVQGSGSSSVTITGTLAQINALLNTDATSAVSYIDPTDTPSPSATLTLAINDNGNSGTGAALTGSDTAIINIGSVNDAPVATITPTTYSATEQVSLNLKNSMSVSDVDSLGGVETATLSVTEGTLTVTAGTSGATVQGSGSSSVTITGTLAQINALLNTDATSAVSYIDPTDTPSPSATLTLAINDNGNSGTGAALTGSDTAIINIGSVNDAPVATITPTTYSATEQVSLNLKNSMSVSDVDSLGGVETATLSVTEGTLTVTAGTSGATVQGSGSSSVTITGTLAQINALLNTDATSAVSYIDPTDTPSPSATLTLAINDNGNSGTGAALTGSDTAIINIGSVNDAPVATITPTTYSATEQVSLNLKNSMSVSDVDSLGGVETATLSVTEGTLTVTAGTSGATVQGSGSSSVTITGTLAQINALLNTDATSAVSYIDPTDTPSPSATLTLAINDNGNSGTGAALTGSDTAIINIGSVNDAPVATITPTTYSATEQVSLNLKNSMSVSDVDSLGGVETATLSVTEGTLTVTAGTSGATVQGSGSSSVTITGTLAQINALLNTDATSAVSYIDPTDTPSPSATLTLAINDNGNSGTGAALTGSDTAIINIGSVNDAPVATITPTTYSATEQVSLNLKNSMSVSDVDSLGGVETATLSVTEGTLTVTAGTSGATVQGSGSSSVTITGTLAQINALLNTDATSAVSYIDPTDTPSPSATLTLAINDNGNSGTGAALTGSDTAIINITAVNDAPVITSGAAAVAVSEEGLPNGVADTLPAIIDTTNSPTASGTITASDADGDPLTMTLAAPITPLTSGGVTIVWTLQDADHTLIGKAGATTIIKATITDAGAYTVTLTGPIDHPVAGQEDIKTFSVPVTVSDGHTTTPTTLSVTIEDDSPKAEPVEVSVVPTDSKTNVMLILDLSGSMNNSSGLTGLTRLDVAKAATSELLDQYDNRGDVMVRIVTFSDTGAAVGSVWMSVAAAKAAIAGLSAGGSTNYDAALLTAMGAFTAGTKLTGPGTQNVSYFLSDGDPTANSDWPQITGTQLANGIQANEQAVWESFLTTNNIVSFALGIPNVGTPANLNPIAFDPASGTQLADTPIIVTDLGQLANTLVFTLPPVTGSVLTGASGATSNSFGADGGGFVQSITVDGVTYTFNPAANGGAGGITTSGGGSFAYDGTTKTLTVDTDTNVVGGELAMVMTTGAFTFQPPTGFSSESVGFVLVDRDGDTASSMLHFSAAGGPDHPPLVRDDHVITNISGGSGTNIVIPDYALVYNDSDADGQTIAITGAITNVLGANSVTHASGNVTFTDNNTNGGSFTYTGSTTSPAASDTGDVTIDRIQTGTTLTGTGFGEILIGRDGTNNTINANEGNDVLIGGTGNDTLNGGAGADMMTGRGGIDTFIINSAQSSGSVGGSGDAGTISGYDVITDFGTATDILNLQGTAAAATGTNVDGTDSSLTISGQTIKSHTISNGIITFDDATSFGSALTLSSTANVAAVVQYLHNNDLGNAGATVAFVASIGGTAHTYIFEQVGNSPSATNDILVDLVGVTLSNLTTLIPSHILPAGVASSPINLGLTEPADHLGPVTVTIAGVPSGWILSEGTDNGDGSWTIQASNVSTLAITSPDKYAGAMAFQLTMSWTNADGSSGFARVTDNVEVFAQGAPIFAWSGDDHLTGSSGKDLFVFAQPIGRDTIYSFNASEDRIDLIGYAGFASFEDVQRHLAEDSAGNAVITLADGQSITIFGVPVSSLNASNFLFDLTPALSNAGTMTIDDGAVLPLSGVIANTGTIALDSAGNETHLELIQNGITLQGGGQILLSDSDENLISGTVPSVTLTNVDNTISGAGQLGAGRMTLINNGTIIAIGTHALVVDTGPNVVTNAGTLEATGSGGLIVNSDIANSGLIWAHGGNITINGAVTGSGSATISGTASLEFGAASSADITFAADAAGTLILKDAADFTGTISGLSSNDQIDLTNIRYAIASVYSVTYSLSTNLTTLVIADGTNTDTINLVGNYTINTAWHFSDDGHGGTIVSDPPVSATSENTLVQSTSAHDLIVSSASTETLSSGDGSAFVFRTNLDDHTITDPVNFAQNDKNHVVQQPADNLLHLPAQLDDNGALTVTDGTHTTHLHFDKNQWASFKFADGSAHPGATLTAPSSDLSGNHGPAALALTETFNVPGTVIAHAAAEQVASSDKFVFGKNFVHDTIADFKPDLSEIDHTLLADIQHLLDTARDTHAVSTLDPNQAIALEHITKVQLPHHQCDSHFA